MRLYTQTSQLDRLSAERTALSVQLDDARAKMSSMERQLKAERDRPHREDIDVESNFPSKLATNGDDSRNAHARKVRPHALTRAVLHSSSPPLTLPSRSPLLCIVHGWSLGSARDDCFGSVRGDDGAVAASTRVRARRLCGVRGAHPPVGAVHPCPPHRRDGHGLGLSVGDHCSRDCSEQRCSISDDPKQRRWSREWLTLCMHTRGDHATPS